MKTIVAYATLSFACSSAIPMQLHGVSLGQPWETKALDTALGWDKASEHDYDAHYHCTDTTCSGFTDIGPCVASIDIDQKDGKVNKIMVLFPPGYFPSVLIALTQKFGKPTETVPYKSTNALGAVLENSFIKWAKDDQELIAIHFIQFDKSAITLEFADKEVKKSLL